MKINMARSNKKAIAVLGILGVAGIVGYTLTGYSRSGESEGIFSGESVQEKIPN